MDEQTKKLQEERNQLFSDFYNNIIPKRMPVQGNICLGYVAGYAKKSLVDVLQGNCEKISRHFNAVATENREVKLNHIATDLERGCSNISNLFGSN